MKIRQKRLAISIIKYYIRYYRQKKKGGDIVKNFFGSIFINRDELREAGIDYPIKVEYYKIINEEKSVAVITDLGNYNQAIVDELQGLDALERWVDNMLKDKYYCIFKHYKNRKFKCTVNPFEYFIITSNLIFLLLYSII